jgi:hypothetical protein
MRRRMCAGVRAGEIMAVVWCRFFRSSQPALLEARAAAATRSLTAGRRRADRQTDRQTDRRRLSRRLTHPQAADGLSTFRSWVSEVEMN